MVCLFMARELSFPLPLSPAPRGFAASSRVLARLTSLAQIGELARRLIFLLFVYSMSNVFLDFQLLM